MKVEAFMTPNVRSCRPGDRLSDAVQLMIEGDCGCVPVVSDDEPTRIVGVITDRDICLATHARGRAPQEIAVGDVMSTEVRCVRSSEDLLDASAIMRDAQVRRLPVVDADQRLVGLLSLADLARGAQRRRGAKKREISEREIGETLAVICASRIPSDLILSA